jgi:hypothetical protein
VEQVGLKPLKNSMQDAGGVDACALGEALELGVAKQEHEGLDIEDLSGSIVCQRVHELEYDPNLSG